MKIIFHKDYKGSKENQCKCGDCSKINGHGCGFNCEYLERQQESSLFDYYNFHQADRAKTYTINENRLCFNGEYSLPGFLCDKILLNKRHADGSQFIELRIKENIGILDRLEYGGVKIDISKIKFIVDMLKKHNRTLIS